jgi:hypothetical protein
VPPDKKGKTLKEFISAVQDIEQEDKIAARVAELVAEGVPPEQAQKKAEEELEPFVPFMVDGRELRAFYPTDGQLVFMLASMGRGQSQQGRFSAIVNVMMESLRDEDQDYLEERLLAHDRKKRLALEKLEEIFEYLVGEWFGAGEGDPERPTQPSSGSAPSQPSDGPNSTTTTDTSPGDSSGSDPTGS